MGDVKEEAVHLFLGLEVEIGAGKLEAVPVVEVGTRVDAEQDIVGQGIFFLNVVGVVGADDLEPVFFGELKQGLVDVFLAFSGAVDIFQSAVPLQFDIKILAEELYPPAELGFGFFQAAVEDGLRDFSTDTTTGGDEAFVVFFEELLVYARELAVEAFYEAQGAELGQVLVARLVFGEQELVVADVLFAFRPGEDLFMAVGHEVELTPDNRLELPLFGFRHKLEGTEHVAMVGQGDAFLAVAHRLVHHFGDARCAIQQGILRVAMQVDKIRHGMGGLKMDDW